MAAPKPIIKQQNNIQQILKNICDNTEDSSIFCDVNLDNETSYSLKDKNNQEFYLISKKNMQLLLESAKKLERDKYLFKLEQEVYKSMPVDFDDVWCIALGEIKDFKKEPRLIVDGLKKRYPYLFLSFLDSLNIADKF